MHASLDQFYWMGEVAGDDCCTTTKPYGRKYGWFGHALWSMVLWFLVVLLVFEL